MLQVQECDEYQHDWGNVLRRNPYNPSEKMRLLYVPCRRCMRYFPLFYVEQVVRSKKFLEQVYKGKEGEAWKAKKITFWDRFKSDNKDW